jgi:hypothetical protein
MRDQIQTFIDSRDAGRLLNMPSARLVRFAKQGIVPCVLLPDGDYRFIAADLIAWAEQHRRAGTTPANAQPDNLPEIISNSN